MHMNRADRAGPGSRRDNRRGDYGARPLQQHEDRKYAARVPGDAVPVLLDKITHIGEVQWLSAISFLVHRSKSSQPKTGVVVGANRLEWLLMIA